MHQLLYWEAGIKAGCFYPSQRDQLPHLMHTPQLYEADSQGKGTCCVQEYTVCIARCEMEIRLLQIYRPDPHLV